MVKFILKFLTIVSLLLISCGNGINNEKLNSQRENENLKYSRLEGLVEAEGNDIFIVVNPDCKCRRSFKVIGSKKEELKRLDGLFVEVEGYIKEFTPWSGEILVKKIHILEK